MTKRANLASIFQASVGAGSKCGKVTGGKVF
jgi:hypothetical protein